MSDQARENLRAMVRGAYDVQKLRIQMGNRIVANFKVKLGQEPGEKEDVIDAEGRAILKSLRASFTRITDGVGELRRRRKFDGDGVIDNEIELRLVAEYLALERVEVNHFKDVGIVLRDFALWTQFLDGVKGVGPAMAGVIISEIDISKARYVSSLWKYAGLDVAEDGRGRSRRKEHLVEREYVDKNGEEKKRNGITFNPFLKTKLTGVLASSFVRVGENKYEQIYRDYKHRLESHAVYGVTNDEARIAQVKADTGKKYSPKSHRDNMAKRYMIKQFLADLYVAWRTLEGLPVAQPYSEAKLGLRHGKAA